LKNSTDRRRKIGKIDSESCRGILKKRSVKNPGGQLIIRNFRSKLNGCINRITNYSKNASTRKARIKKQ
jgi:hypothetical protein